MGKILLADVDGLGVQISEGRFKAKATMASTHSALIARSGTNMHALGFKDAHAAGGLRLAVMQPIATADAA